MLLGLKLIPITTGLVFNAYNETKYEEEQL